MDQLKKSNSHLNNGRNDDKRKGKLFGKHENNRSITKLSKHQKSSDGMKTTELSRPSKYHRSRIKDPKDGIANDRKQ